MSHESLPKVHHMSPNSTRMKHALARWKEKPHEVFWERVIEKINKSAFCRGKNDRNWKADFDFFVRPDTADRVLGGKYDDKQAEPQYVTYTVQVGDELQTVRERVK